MTVTIGRRELLAALGGAAAGWPLAARAQQMRRIRRIGVLMSTTPDDVEGQARIAAFLKGLQQWGWAVPGNVRIDTRWGAGDADRIRNMRRSWLRSRQTSSWPVAVRSRGRC